MAKATSLIKAYKTESIPSEGGFIVSAFFQPDSNYAIYEITAYRNVKDIYQTADGMIFKTDGNRAFILVEPPTYSKKHIDPVNRVEGKSIPFRLSEVEIYQTKRVEKVMVPEKHVDLYGSFTVVDQGADSFSFVFHPTKDVYIALRKFIADSLYNDCDLRKEESKDIAVMVLKTIKEFAIWNRG